MDKFSDIFNEKWNILLVQGGVSSGKSQLGLMLASKMVEKNREHLSENIRDLLHFKNMAILTERLAVPNSDPLFKKIQSRSHLIEFITSINIFEKIQYLYEYQGVNFVFLDYVNLLTHQYYNFEKMINFMDTHRMRGVFIENTAKLKHYDFNLYKRSDVVLKTSLSKFDSHSLEVGVLKFFNTYVSQPQEFHLKIKDLHKII